MLSEHVRTFGEFSIILSIFNILWIGMDFQGLDAYRVPLTGGYNVYSVRHKFSDVKAKGASMSGGDAEKAVGRMLARKGKQVEFLEEMADRWTPYPDLKFDAMTWDVKYIDVANENTIRDYIKNARKADCALFYWEDGNKLASLENAVARNIGYFKQKAEIMPSVYYINKDGVLKLLYKRKSR